MMVQPLLLVHTAYDQVYLLMLLYSHHSLMIDDDDDGSNRLMQCSMYWS